LSSRTSASRACSAPIPAPSSRRCRSASATPTPTRRAQPHCAPCSPPACSRTSASRSTGRWPSSSSTSGPSSPRSISSGLKEFDKDTLTKSLKDAGIGEGLPFDRALVDRAEQEIKRQYLSRSLYGAEVVTTITPLERNRVNVTFTMTEGDAAQIKRHPHRRCDRLQRIHAEGADGPHEGGWLTWYTKSDRYSRAKLNADLETLRAYYVNRGYLEFEVESTQVTISPDKQSISIAITIREGSPTPSPAVKLEGRVPGA
jgi:outer membrane protein assembly factor BamA